MSTFFWPSYIEIEELRPGADKIAIEIQNALNELSYIEEFRDLAREYYELSGQKLRIIPSSGIGSLSDFYENIIIDDTAATVEFLGLDGKFHEFSLEMVILHEIAHKIDSFILPDPGDNETSTMDHIQNHQNEINRTLEQYGLDPIQDSDTDKEKRIKATQAEEIRVINKINEIRAKYFPHLPLRDPTSHSTIDMNKVRIGQGKPGWEDAENEAPKYVEKDDRINLEQIKDFLKDLSQKEAQELFGISAKEFNDPENFNMIHLWELANESVFGFGSDDPKDYLESFKHQFGVLTKEQPQIVEKIIDAYKKGNEHAQYDATTNTQTAALDQNKTFKADLPTMS